MAQLTASGITFGDGSYATGTAYNAVGSYVMAMSSDTFGPSSSATPVEPGTTVTGSSLCRGVQGADAISPFNTNEQTPISTAANITALGLSGAWRLMTRIRVNNVYTAMGLYVRIL